MWIKNILILTVFFSWGTYHFTEAEIIRGVDVPRVDVTKLEGTWYLLSSDEENEPLACSISVVTKTSDDSYTTNVTYSFKPEAKEKNPNLPSGPGSFTFTHELQKDSSIIVGKNKKGMQRAMIIFDVDYDSHMLMYVTNSTAEIASGDDGRIIIVGRHKTLPAGLLDKVKESVFYKQGVKPDFHLYALDTSGCP